VTDSTPNCNGGCEGIVAAYNFAINGQYTAPNWFQSSYYDHSGGSGFNLLEGNIGTGFTADNIHGTRAFWTLYRNFFPGWQQLCSLSTDACTLQTYAINIYSGSRYFNIINNVLGTPSYHTAYDCLATSTATCANANVSVYSVGYTANGSSSDSGIAGYCDTQSPCSNHVAYDAITVNTLMRYGNWDSKNATTRCVSSEVPTGLSQYSNPVPSTCPSSASYPASFFFSSKPSWWGSLPWPGIGSDVTGGNVGQCSGGTYNLVPGNLNSDCAGGNVAGAWGGRVNVNPAMQCAVRTMGMPIDGSGGALSFNAGSCYSGGGGLPSGSTPPTISLSVK